MPPKSSQSAGSDSFIYDVFISYSHHDEDWTQNWLLPRLEAAGIHACIDFRDFQPGAPSLNEMERAVLQSCKTLLVLTPDYLASAWTEFENILAQTLDPAARQRRLQPLLLKPCELPLRIRTLTYLDFTRSDRVDFQMERLIAAIKSETRVTSSPPLGYPSGAVKSKKVSKSASPVKTASGPLPQSGVPSSGGINISGSTIYIGGDLAGRDKHESDTLQPPSDEKHKFALKDSLPLPEVSQFRELLVEHFGLEDLRTLCFDLNVDYESLPGEGKAGKARELVAYLKRRDRLTELGAAIRRTRPDITI
jgi:hypothetical protein